MKLTYTLGRGNYIESFAVGIIVCIVCILVIPVILLFSLIALVAGITGFIKRM